MKKIKKVWGQRGAQLAHRPGVIVVDQRTRPQEGDDVTSPPTRPVAKVHPDHRTSVRTARNSRPSSAPSVR